MHGLYLLWWVQEKDTPPAIVAAVLAAGDLMLLAVELPTGWFAECAPRITGKRLRHGDVDSDAAAGGTLGKEIGVRSEELGGRQLLTPDS